jgi:hypothetical protein
VTQVRPCKFAGRNPADTCCVLCPGSKLGWEKHQIHQIHPSSADASNAHQQPKQLIQQPVTRYAGTAVNAATAAIRHFHPIRKVSPGCLFCQAAFGNRLACLYSLIHSNHLRKHDKISGSKFGKRSHCFGNTSWHKLMHRQYLATPSALHSIANFSLMRL